MRFFVARSDLQLGLPKSNSRNAQIKTYTSPLALEKWFLESLRKLGKIVFLNKKSIQKEEIKTIAKSPESIFLSFRGRNGFANLTEIPKRVLRLSHCDFLLPESFFSFKDFLPAQVDLVSTIFEKKKIKNCLGNSSPEIGVFTPKVDTDFFCLPDKRQIILARKRRGLTEDQIHIVYAGRWIVSKGLAQLIRILSIWPLPKVVITFVGNFEPEFPIHYAVGNHRTFAEFLKQECISQISQGKINFETTKTAASLRDLFWSANLFINPSVHADENFGITPRQAAACGVPVLTTNFCGLRSLAESMPWGGVNTYPTLHGSRFSLRQFYQLIICAITKSESYSAREYRRAILRECDPQLSQNNLAKAIQCLKKIPLKSSSEIKGIKRRFNRKVCLEANEKIVDAFFFPARNIQSGCYMYGSSQINSSLMALQGVYSAIDSPLKVDSGSSWRGFFRIGIWKEEKMLLEFGYPGPRMFRFQDKRWKDLITCAYLEGTNEWVFTPKNKEQINIVQELVDFGYLVLD